MGLTKKLCDNIQIVEFDRCREHWDTIMSWHLTEWGDDWLSIAQQATVVGVLPIMFVALYEGQPIGTSFITTEDLPTRKDLGPWLAGVYVRKDWRGRGIGPLLTEHAMAWARSRELSQLFLFVYQEKLISFYVRLGWSLFKKELTGDIPICIMVWYPMKITGRQLDV